MGPASSGRCLGGGGGSRPILLGRGLQQGQLLGQAAAGFHHHVMFDLLPDPDFQVLLELLLLHDARLLGSDNTTAFSRAPILFRGRRCCLALCGLVRLELALPLRHDPARNGRGVAVVAGRHREPWDTAGRKNARTHGIQCGTELKRQYPVIVVDHSPSFQTLRTKR